MRQPHRIAELALQQIANDCGLVLPELAAFDRKVETGFLEGQSISSIWMRPSCTGSTELAISISLRARLILGDQPHKLGPCEVNRLRRWTSQEF